MPSLPSAASSVLAEVSRSGHVESWHAGAVAVWHEQQPLLEWGDTAAPVFCRSAVKPLQALPLLERGLATKFGLQAPQLAVLCASHDGTQAHVDAVREFLRRAGIDEQRLGCGPHAPFDPAARRAMLAAGQQPERVHNNCSGKHTGFLCLARELGDPLEDYLEPGCRSQTEVQAAVGAMCGVEPPIEVGVDGCGAPTFRLPLRALARAFSQLANPDGHSPVRRAACQQILQAAAEQPVLVAGERRLCTALLRSLPGRVFPKNGAEGVYAVALAPDPDRRLCPGAVGVAIKVHDGAERGYQAVAVELLRALGCWSGQVPPSLAAFHQPPVNNTRGVQVGEVRCVVDWAGQLQGERS